MNHDRYLELRCQSCAHRHTYGLLDMIDHLRSVGMFKRQKEPDEHLVRELFAGQVSLLPCPKCGHVGSGPSEADEFDDTDWGVARTCEACSEPIPADRLEVFPDTTRCTRCQQAAERGEDVDADPEYCPHCGSIMELRQRGGAGLAGYVMSCPSCGYK